MPSTALSEPGITPELVRAKPTQAGAARTYDAFISYSHAKDKPIAAALQWAMQRLGKAWHQRRALRIYRDETSQSATPGLWVAIQEALSQSRFLILMASAEAAASPWVDRELAWWLDHRGADTVLIALTAGDLAWNGSAGDFSWAEATPLPPALKGRFADEPRWIDLRPYREHASPRDARFTELAAALHGRAKEDLLSQEVRQQRRALRLAGTAVALLLVLLGVAGWQWSAAEGAKRAALAAQHLAVQQRQRAEHNLSAAEQAARALVFDIAQSLRLRTGMPQDLIQRILERADAILGQLASTSGGEPELLALQADGLLEIDETFERNQKSELARGIYDRCRTILEQMVTVDPGNANLQDRLAITYNRIGDLLRQREDIDGALAAYRLGEHIREYLATTAPDNPNAQFDFANSRSRLASIKLGEGDITGALKMLHESNSMIKRIADGEPNSSEWQIGLAVSDMQIGDVLRVKGDLAGALAAYGDALPIRKALTKKDPGNAEWQNDLAKSYQARGNILAEEDDLAGALKAYRDAQEILEQLATAEPDIVQQQGALAMLQDEIGIALVTQKDFDNARLAFRVCQSILDSIVAADPNNADWQRKLLTVLDHMGSLEQGRYDLSNALRLYNHGLEISKKFLGANPDDAKWQQSLATSYDRVGHVLRLQRKFDDAVGAFRSELSVSQHLLNIDPNNVDFQRAIFLSQYELGDVLLRISNILEAKEHALTALTFARRLYETLKTDHAKEDLRMAESLVSDLNADTR